MKVLCIHSFILTSYPIPVPKGMRLGPLTSPLLFNSNFTTPKEPVHSTCTLCGFDVSLMVDADDILNAQSSHIFVCWRMTTVA